MNRVAAEAGATPSNSRWFGLRAELNTIDPMLQGAVSRDASETVKMPA